MSGQLHATAALSPGVRASGTYLQEVWVGPKAGLDVVAKRKNSIIAPAGNSTPVIQPVA
jgi:hypothetical protein